VRRATIERIETVRKKEKLEMLRALDEKRLTKEILVGLFERMGFENVVYQHGVLEYGKDVVYREDTRYHTSKYIGVQVKSANINTKMANELFCQVTVGLGSPFQDLADNCKKKEIDEFIVLTSGEIEEHAREHIISFFKGAHIGKPVSFITGENLVRLLDEYMPSVFWEEYDYFNKYFNAMKDDFTTIKDVSAIGQKESIALEEIYVSLKVSEEVREREIPAETEWKIFEEKLSRREKEELERRTDRSKVIDAERAVKDYDRLVIVGDPGSGKTTLLKYLALKSCKENLEKQERVCVPIPIILRELVEKETGLREYIEKVFEKYEFPKAKKFVEKDLKAGRCRLLLDGFDELATKESQEKVAGEIRKFAKKYRKSQIIVTSRRAGYHDELKVFTKVELMEFDDKQIERFVENWFGKRSPVKARLMFDAVVKNKQIRTLARNPLMVAIVAIIYEEDRKLPQRRADLYKRCVEVLLSKWDVQKRLRNNYPADKKEFFLRKLAFYGHSNNKRVMKQDEVTGEMLKYFPQLGLHEKDVKGFLDEIWQRSYLLRQISMNSYDFLHLSFQEYFTALEMKNSKDGISTIIEHLAEPWWEEPILLYAGISKDASGLIERIKEEVQEDIFCNNLILFGKCIVDAEFTEPSLREEIVNELWSLYKNAEFQLLKEKGLAALGLIKPDRIISSLIKNLEDQEGQSADVRWRAAEALGSIGSEKAIEPLLKAMATDKDSSVRGSAAYALGSIGSEKAIEPLLKAMATDKDSSVRWRAAYALGSIGSEKAIEPLKKALTDEGEYVGQKVKDAAFAALEKVTMRCKKRIVIEGK